MYMYIYIYMHEEFQMKSGTRKALRVLYVYVAAVVVYCYRQFNPHGFFSVSPFINFEVK